MMLVFLLEELSAKEMLRGILPRLLPEGIRWQTIVFEGKQDLEKRMGLKIRGWQFPDSHFVILRDKDSDDCYAIKKRLQEKSENAGQSDALIRIACHELESWHLGDLSAIERGLEIHLSQSQKSAKFRNPDLIANASEELNKITKFRYQKVGGSRAISPYLNLESNTSISFRIFIEGLCKLITKRWGINCLISTPQFIPH